MNRECKCTELKHNMADEAALMIAQHLTSDLLMHIL